MEKPACDPAPLLLLSQMFLYNHVGQRGIGISIGRELALLAWGHGGQPGEVEVLSLEPGGLTCFGAEDDGGFSSLTGRLHHHLSHAAYLWSPGQRPLRAYHHCCLS